MVEGHFAKTLPLRDQRPSSLTLTKPKVLNIRSIIGDGCTIYYIVPHEADFELRGIC